MFPPDGQAEDGMRPPRGSGGFPSGEKDGAVSVGDVQVEPVIEKGGPKDHFAIKVVPGSALYSVAGRLWLPHTFVLEHTSPTTGV